MENSIFSTTLVVCTVLRHLTVSFQLEEFLNNINFTTPFSAYPNPAMYFFFLILSLDEVQLAELSTYAKDLNNLTDLFKSSPQSLNLPTV